MTNQTYVEKLKDPRWQRKRLEIMKRDKFQCVKCKDCHEEIEILNKAKESLKFDDIKIYKLKSNDEEKDKITFTSYKNGCVMRLDLKRYDDIFRVNINKNIISNLIKYFKKVLKNE